MRLRARHQGALRSCFFDRDGRVHLDAEPTQQGQCPVERLEAFAGLDSCQSAPIEAQRKLVDYLLLSQAVFRPGIAHNAPKVGSRPHSVPLCAHIGTSYRLH